MKLSETTAVIGRAMPRRWQRILVFGGLWTLIGFLSAVHWWYFPPGRYPYAWWQLVAVKVSLWWAWGLVTLLVLFLANRFPLIRPVRWSGVPVLLAASVAVTLAYLGVYVVLLLVGIHGRPEFGQFRPMFQFVMSVHSTFYYLAFWAIVVLENAMLSAQRHHVQEMRHSALQAELTEARLSALQSQLQPHFFFNTLNTISSMIVNDEREEANELIVRLSELVRFNFEHAGSQTVTLEEELTFVRLYLDLMKARFEEKLDATVEVAEEAKGVRVPTMILQPLVENAVKYSAVAGGGRGVVCLRAVMNEKGLVITLVNNRAAGNIGGAGTGVGLKITRERLATVYGEDGVLTMEEGTDEVSVTLRIPANVSGARR